MPKKKRKYPSKKKTTTPEGYREYKKLQMREYRRRKKDEFDRIVARMLQLDKKFLNNVLGSRPNTNPKKKKKTRKKGRKK